MAPRIVVVGLGPGSPDLLTQEAWEVIAGARVLYLRTERHPVVAHLPAHLELRAFDDYFQSGQDLAQAAEAVVNHLMQSPELPAVYAVPGHPLVAEATTRLLLRRLGREEVRLVAGLSFLEPACTALGLDPLEQGLQLIDALELAVPASPFLLPPPLDPTRPLLVAGLCDGAVAAGVAETLRQRYPEDHPAAKVRATGIAGQEEVWWGTLRDLEGPGRPAHLDTLYVPPLERLQARRETATLEWVCARLRGPGGCPWDREQDHSSLRNNLLEECYEVLGALDRQDLKELRKELGDLLMQVFLHAQLAREEGAFTLADVVEGITAKLIRRHPHVFDRLAVADSGEVLRNWEAIKAEERGEEGKEGASLLDGLPPALPALAYAQAIGRRVARVGFDWDRVAEVWAKVEEEMAELRQAETDAARSEELGDALFSLVNLARWLGIEAEDALRATNSKFRHRFRQLEEEAGRRGISLEQMQMAEMDASWEEAKESERPLVYVIIPSHNTADYLCRCLDSLRAQREGPALDLFVVDNASSDDSVRRVRQGYPEAHLLESDRNGGFAYAVNLALRGILASRHRQSRPDYVLLLNSDTELPPDALGRMVAFMEDHAEAGAAGPKLLMGDGRMDLAGRRSFPSPAVAFYRLFGLSRLFPRSPLFGRYNLTCLDPDRMAEVDSVCGAFMLVRGEVAAQVGLLDEAFFMYGEDLDWAYRIKEQGWKVYYVPQVQVRHWKRVSSRKQPRATLKAFYQAMRIFHRKHYAPRYAWPVNRFIEAGISLRYGLALVGQLFRRREGSA